MEITLTLNRGPLDAEFKGEDLTELEENLLQFMEFLEKNEETLEGVELTYNEVDTEDEPGLDADHWEKKQEESAQTTQDDDIPSQGSVAVNSDLKAIVKRTDFSPSTIDNYFDIDPEGEEPPYLNFDVETLGESGNSRSEKQMRASLILLTLWRECNKIEEVRSPSLKDALRISGIDDTDTFNMYQFNDGEGDRYFRRDGSGANTDISLTMPGKREGFDQIQRTVERLEGEADE
ncbi:hypothetical protein HYG81_01750 [Natrinema zhouii]|uniref:Uncharacterized protein n=1 Tax=Natrinema zhouii TaxID=1710539 RepID=A0A7D6CQP8_9EURY|nr:hypothetical protein [Natrinema zhouii]QLK26369.1 hypothetical protein HYG81_01750 [Natrinema zhouii]